MAKYYLEYVVEYKESDSLHCISEGSSIADAKKRIREQAKEEHGNNLIGVKFHVGYRTSDDARAD